MGVSWASRFAPTRSGLSPPTPPHRPIAQFLLLVSRIDSPVLHLYSSGYSLEIPPRIANFKMFFFDGAQLPLTPLKKAEMTPLRKTFPKRTWIFSPYIFTIIT